jgi:uncharacterized protein
MLHVLRTLLLASLVLFPAMQVHAGDPAPIAWQSQWSQALFDRATREHRLVLLDLHALWCHWCHVMDEQTYSDPTVRTLVGQKYIAVSVDADSDPALTSRYGDWGWPATIVLAADGTEIVKRRGFIPPAQMQSLLQAIIADPSPGPSVQSAAAPMVIRTTVLEPATQRAMEKFYDELYDPAHGGWGSIHKYLDAPTLEYTLALADSSATTPAAAATANKRARQTLDANLKLIDPVWGGVYQYSDAVDWSSPHYEKLLAFQADDLRLYSLGYARWHDPQYLAAAQAVRKYLLGFLTSPDGAFYVSQDADLSARVHGKEYYAGDEVARRRLGIPRIDAHVYARENGWAISALCAFHDATGDAAALAAAAHAAAWIIRNRALPGGGFSHDAKDRGGPYLEDTIAMGEAFLGLYRSSGERSWLVRARAAMDFVEGHFRQPEAGFFSAPVSAAARGVFREPTRVIEQNVAVVRLANRLHWYSGDAHYQNLALHGMKYLVATAQAQAGLHADILLTDRELAAPPIHITVVGAKSDPAAQALHAAALSYPAEYLQVDWLDRSEGPLPNPEIRYPTLSRAAAFACSPGTCSTPVYTAEAIAPAVQATLAGG